jgi:hypothetical protein
MIHLTDQLNHVFYLSFHSWVLVYQMLISHFVVHSVQLWIILPQFHISLSPFNDPRILSSIIYHFFFEPQSFRLPIWALSWRSSIRHSFQIASGIFFLEIPSDIQKNSNNEVSFLHPWHVMKRKSDHITQEFNSNCCVFISGIRALESIDVDGYGDEQWHSICLNISMGWSLDLRMR